MHDGVVTALDFNSQPHKEADGDAVVVSGVWVLFQLTAS